LAGKTQLVTVNNLAATAIVASTYCKKIAVSEDQSVNNWPTVAYNVMRPTPSDDPRRIGKGQIYTFERIRGIYVPGDIVGYIQAVAGSSTFVIDQGGDA
jgi:hypothetical protein